MARSRRFTDGARWRTFMLLLRLEDLMASYTNTGLRSCSRRSHVLI